MTTKPASRLLGSAVLLLPLLLVNAAAVYGQTRWAYDHLGHDPAVAVLFALAVESIGVYLAYEAHAARMASHAAGPLQLGAYAVGGLIGTLNFSHFAGPKLDPNALAVTFGALSAISPWLWAIRSRSLNRTRLFELGLVDPRAVKFSRLRWALFPVRTFSTFRAAVWAGVQSPAEAIALRTPNGAGQDRTAPDTETPLSETPVSPVSPIQPRRTLALAAAPRMSHLPARRPAPIRASETTDAVRDEVERLHREGKAPGEIVSALAGRASRATVYRHIQPLRATNGATLSEVTP